MKPKTSLTFRQEITYDFDCIDDFLDKPVYIEWVYENSIDTWKGGYETLDGIAKTLFDGEKIPNIFVGRLVATSGEARFVSEKGKALQNN